MPKTKTSTRLTDKEARAVLQTWRLKPIFMRPAGGTANASLAIVGTRGQYVLRRRNPRYSDPRQLTYDHSVIHGLAKAGLPVPKIVRAPSGSRWVEHDERIYELFELIEGLPADPDSHEEIAAAGDMLARLHLATERLQPSGEKQWPRYFDPKVSLKALKETRKALKEARGRVGPPTRNDESGSEDEPAYATVDFLIGQAELAERGLPDKAYWALPQTIIHGDWHPANLRFRDHQIVGIFDFDWVGRQPRMVDVTDGLLFFGSRRESAIDGGDIWSLTQPFAPDRQLMQVFMAAYRAHVNLTREELVALPALMRQRCLYNRVDAMVRKVEPQDQVRFLVTGIRGPFEWIAEHEKELSRAAW